MKNNIVVGSFVIVGLILFTAGLFLIGSRHKAFDKHVEFYTEFANVGGLANGAKIRVGGLEAGQVVHIGIPSSPASRFRLELQLDEKMHGLVRTDSLASIETEGVVGDTYIQIKPGSTQAPEAGSRSTLPSKEPLDLSAMLDKGNGLLNDVSNTVKDADRTINNVSGKLDGSLDEVKTTVSNVNDVVVGVKQGRGAVGMLLSNKEFAAQVQQTVGNANHATADLAHASNQADQMISDLGRRNLPQKVDDTMNNVQGAAAQLNASSQQIHEVITDATRPDSQGVPAGSNIREALSNTNAATSNLADDTEALKHEFFFKGFFKNRGYYDLTHLSPNKYRTDKLFTNPANTRVWLSGADLFQSHPDGTEDLSLTGKAALDDYLAQNGASVVERPLVVEGYRSGAAPAAELASSRKRAMLVGDYLQNHFQLDPRNVGFVSLQTSPPAGTGHQNWDGVCIVLLQAKHK